MSHLDLFTVLIIQSISCGIFGIFLYKLKENKQKKYPSFVYIMHGFFGYSIGLFILSMRDFLPYPIFTSIILGNFIFLIGVMYLTYGIKQLYGVKEKLKLYIIQYLAVAAIFYYLVVIDDQAAARIILMSFAISFLFFQTAIKLHLIAKKDNSKLLNGLICVLVIYAIIYFSRLILTIINYNNIIDFFSYSTDTYFQIASVLMLLVIFINIIVIINRLLSNEIELKLAENSLLIQELEALTQLDYLTGLYNRKSLEEKTKNLIETCSVNKKTFQFLLIDLDGFKEVNDQFGHKFGDQILIKFGEMLQRYSEYVYRFGGDEFIIILEDSDSTPQKVIEQLVTEFAACDNEQNCFPSFSYGIHEWQHGESYNDVMSIADQMMYTDKRHEKKTIK